MEYSIVIVAGLGMLAFFSGMLGLGVAFAAVPFLSFFLPDLVNQVQPLTLLLNGLTALLVAYGFGKSGFIDWKKAIILAIVTTSAAPIGSYFVHFIDQNFIWYIYLVSVVFLTFGLFKPMKNNQKEKRFKLAIILAVPMSILAGFLGSGPGFLLMPTLILLGFEPKQAAGINAFAVAPPSFSALIPHLSTAKFDINLTIMLLVAGGIGAFAGARISSLYIPNQMLKQLFGCLIVVMTLYRVAVY